MTKSRDISTIEKTHTYKLLPKQYTRKEMIREGISINTKNKKYKKTKYN